MKYFLFFLLCFLTFPIQAQKNPDLVVELAQIAEPLPLISSKKQLTTAYMASLLNTALPVVAYQVLSQKIDSDALIWIPLYAMSVGPSGGHLYTRDWKRVGIGSASRLVGTAMVISTAFLCFESGCTGHEKTRQTFIQIIGGVMYIGGLAYSLATTPKSVISYNLRHEQKVKLALALLPDNTQKPHLGISMYVSF
ncbi:MAG: hypothetical protein JNN12_10950 [Bacteroidetes Order II. Incertae sedis bacterium]|nr:hypothetical protein [Bacteroidetes Order II. bacterium]